MENGFLLTEVEAVGQLLDRDLKLPGIDRIGIELDLVLHQSFWIDFSSRAASSIQPWPEESGDAAGVANADLDVIQGAQASGRIHRRAFIEEPAHTVKRRLASSLAELMNVIDHRAVEKPGFGLQLCISWRLLSIRFTSSQQVTVTKRNQICALGISEVKTVSKVDDGASNPRFSNS